MGIMDLAPEAAGLGGTALTEGFNLFGDVLGMAMRGVGAGEYARLTGEGRETLREAENVAIGGVRRATDTAGQQRGFAIGDYLGKAESGPTAPGESLATATRLREDVLTNLRKDRGFVRDFMGSAITEAQQSGKDIVASVADNLGQRIGALSRELKNEQDQAFVNIDSEMTAGNLTPAAAAEMKQKVRLEGARRIGDEGAMIASDFSELKTLRMSEGADRVADLQTKFGEYETAFDLGAAQVGSVMNDQVLSAISSDRDFERSLYDVTLNAIEAAKTDEIAEHMMVHGMTLTRIGLEDSQNATYASMIAGIPPAEWSFDPGAGLTDAAVMLSQRRAANEAKPD